MKRWFIIVLALSVGVLMACLRGYQVKKATMKHLMDSVGADTTKVMGLKVKYAVQSMSDPKLSKGIDKLTGDYVAMLGAE